MGGCEIYIYVRGGKEGCIDTFAGPRVGVKEEREREGEARAKNKARNHKK
jgi:hypothetical protein